MALSLKEKKNTCDLLYPGEIKLPTLFSRQSFAELLWGKWKWERMCQKIILLLCFFNTPINENIKSSCYWLMLY